MKISRLRKAGLIVQYKSLYLKYKKKHFTHTTQKNELFTGVFHKHSIFLCFGFFERHFAFGDSVKKKMFYF